jgi:spermidine/putrescine transport system substrate-binding protein
MKWFGAIIGLLFSLSTFATDNVVNVYNYTGYIPDTVLAQFTKETGIQVNYSTFASDEELYSKLAASDNRSGYDVVITSTDYLSRMIHNQLLLPLDKTKISNFKNLLPQFVNQEFDPGNGYSVPYLWGSAGLVVNRKYFPNLKLTHWAQLWEPQFKNQILMIDEMRTSFDVGLKVLNYSVNTQDPAQIKQAYEQLVALMPNIKLFNITGPQSIYANEDATIGLGFNGDIYMAIQRNPNIEFIYPEDGVFLWLDSMVIPNNAPHLENAYKFMNFILRADIGEQIAENIGYSSPNAAAIKLLPPEIRNNPILYPSAAQIKNSSFEVDIGSANEIYQNYWQMLKLGGS